MCKKEVSKEVNLGDPAWKGVPILARYHCTCIGIDDHEYDYLSASEENCECSVCWQRDLRALNSVDAIDVYHFDFQNFWTYPHQSSL